LSREEFGKTKGGGGGDDEDLLRKRGRKNFC
jgi:hypothetical protein